MTKHLSHTHTRYRCVLLKWAMSSVSGEFGPLKQNQEFISSPRCIIWYLFLNATTYRHVWNRLFCDWCNISPTRDTSQWMPHTAVCTLALLFIVGLLLQGELDMRRHLVYPSERRNGDITARRKPPRGKHRLTGERRRICEFHIHAPSLTRFVCLKHFPR